MFDTKFQRFLIVGSGRLATHLQTYFTFLGLPFATWSRRDQWTLQESIAGSSHILFAVSDRAIAELSAPILSAQKVLVHFSGALQVSGVVAAHPVMTFAERTYDFETYQQIPFVIDEGFEFNDLLPGLKNPWWSLNPNSRAHYHALVSLAGNFPHLLWSQIGRELKSLGLEPEILRPLLHQTVDNACTSGLASLTGPVVRRDLNTIERHLAALENSETLASTYRQFLSMYADATRRFEYEHPRN